MTTINYLAEGWGGITPTDGLSATGNSSGGNSGASSVTALSGGIAIFRAASAVNGSFGWRVTNAANNAAILRFPAIPGTVQMKAVDFTCPALPTSADMSIDSLRYASGSLLVPQLTPTGKLRLLQSSGATTVGGRTFPGTGDPAPTATLTPGNRYRLEYGGNGAGTATGNAQARIYDLGAGVADHLGGVVSANNAANLSGGTFTHGDTGIVGGFAEVRTLDFDNVRFSDIYDWQGPYVAGAVTPLVADDITLSVVPTEGPSPLSVAITVTVRAGAGTGTPFRYSATWGDGASTAPQVSNVLTHTYTTTGGKDGTVTVVNT